MAERHVVQTENDKEFIFNNVELFKKEALGSGSYGIVCKAKCDQLTCAAKLLHAALFEQPQADPGKEHRQPFRRFESECRILSRINHPNVVQYLGTCIDPETNSPVLLMELMDESLTHFLELSPVHVTYHIQVNLASDIARALAFLHANGIIHRDLSSNNVLLIAGNRAKITDFGMLGFIDTKRLATMTSAPGTPAFMPPEALNEPPLYTDKLDSFSFGVLLVQILTRQFPNPGDRFEQRELLDPKLLNQAIQANVAIPEVTRRQAHISLIEPTHPLLRIAIHCLKDGDRERPSSHQLCQSLDPLKTTAKYEESLQQDLGQCLRTKDEQIRSKDQQLQELKEEIKTRDEQIRTKDDQIWSRDQHIKAKDEIIQSRNEQIRTTVHGHEKTISELTERLEEAMQRNEVLQNEREEKEKLLRALNLQLESREDIIAQRDREVRKLRATSLTSISEESQDSWGRLHPIAISTQQPQASQTNHVRKEKCFKMRWEYLPSSPVNTYAGSATLIGKRAYFRPGASRTVYEFNSHTSQWSTLPAHPFYSITIVAVNNMLTTVGGGTEYQFADSSNKLYSHSHAGREWIEHFPPMPTKRRVPSAVCTNNTLIVAGGYDGCEVLTTVEILNTFDQQWSTATSLPLLGGLSSMVICGDMIYSHSISTLPGHDVLKCSLSELVSCSRSASWEKICSLPVQKASLVSIDGTLLAVGGLSEAIDATRNIHQYDPTTNSWRIVSEMSVARYQCLTVSLPGSKLIVVGGYPAGKTMELGTAKYF